MSRKREVDSVYYPQPDALALAKEAATVGLISQNVLEELTSLRPSVPNLLKLRYLLLNLYDTVTNDEQLFMRMVHVFATSESSSSLPSPASDFKLGPEHVRPLVHLLTPCCTIALCESIRKALKLTQPIKCYVPHLYLTEMLTDWVRVRSTHVLPPMLSVLENILNTPEIGLGHVACQLRTNFNLNQRLGKVNKVLPYSVQKVGLGDSDLLGRRERVVWLEAEAEENASALLEVQSYYSVIQYRWLLNGKPMGYYDSAPTVYTGHATPILCISKADIKVDGAQYSCKLVLKGGNELTTAPVTLTVRCPLDEYTASLASMYSAQPDVPKDTWPPVSNTKHINLALIKQEQVNYGAPYVRHTIRGDLDDILQHKQKIEYAEAVRGLKSKHVLFIEGRPGSGKTTFVHKITRDWATAPYGAIRLLLLVSLRVLNDLNKPQLDLSDILGLFNDLKVSKELLEKRDGKGVCFVFDGLDEFSPRDGEKSLVFKIINKEYLNQSSVLVASRPAALTRLRDRASRVIEVLGFPNEQILEYFDSYPFSVSSKSEELKNYLDDHPNILHMCYLPIHSVMVAYLFEVTGKVPETEIYSHFTRFTLMRSLTKNKAVTVCDIANYSLSEEEKILFNQICKLALEKTIANKQVLRQDEVDAYFESFKDGDISLGLITVDRTADLYGFKNIYTFLHLTFQEYLAARHIFALTNEEQYELILKHGDKSHMLVVWKFVCGLIKFDANDVRFEAIVQRSLTNSLFLVHSAYESQQRIVCDLLLGAVGSNFSFESHFLTAPDFTALGYVIASSSSPPSLSFIDCDMSVEAVNAMLSESGGKSLSVHSLLYCSKNSECFQKIVLNCTGLKVLDIPASIHGYRNFSELPLSRLTSVLGHCTNLTEFTISFFKLRDAADSLTRALCCCKKIRTLNLHHNGIGNSGANAIFTSTRCWPQLKSLDLSCNSINSKVASVISTTLKHCSNLSSLNLNENSIGEEGAMAISSSLQYWPNFQALHLSGSKEANICTSGVVVLAKNLHSCPKLKSLNLSYNNINSKAATFLAKSLAKCTKLDELYLAGNNISKDSQCVTILQGYKHLKHLTY